MAELNVGISQQEQTIIHLAFDSPFMVEPPKEFKDYPGLQVLSLKDIAANKLGVKKLLRLSLHK